jgi:hypothetical protein
MERLLRHEGYREERENSALKNVRMNVESCDPSPQKSERIQSDFELQNGHV